MRAVLEDLRQVPATLLDEIMARDDHGHAARPDVLLGARVDEGERRDVELARKDVARHVADLGSPPEGRQLAVLHAVDGLIARVVNVRRGVVEGRFVGARYARVAALAGRRGDSRERPRDAGPGGRLRVRLLGPGAEDDVVRRAAGRQEAHGEERELHRRAALKEDHVVAGRNAEELANQAEGLVVHGLVHLVAVRVLHHGHARAREIEELGARPLESGQRKRPGAGVEIHRASHGGQAV